MSEQLVIAQCAPTLAGLKTGSLFTCPYTSKPELIARLRRWNQLLVQKGLRALPLRFSSTRALIYLYRTSWLKKDLNNQEAARLLSERGYNLSCPEQCIAKLAQRIQTQSEFPHEIGLFLGYPVEDVCGFIENKPCKCIGCWKVYGDVEKAQKQFARFDQCTHAYKQQLANGSPMDRLIIAS